MPLRIAWRCVLHIFAVQQHAAARTSQCAPLIGLLCSWPLSLYKAAVCSLPPFLCQRRKYLLYSWYFLRGVPAAASIHRAFSQCEATLHGFYHDEELPFRFEHYLWDPACWVSPHFPLLNAWASFCRERWWIYHHGMPHTMDMDLFAKPAKVSRDDISFGVRMMHVNVRPTDIFPHANVEEREMGWQRAFPLSLAFEAPLL